MPYIYAKIYPKVMLNYEKDKIIYRTFESLDDYILFDDYNHPLEFTAEYVREQIIKLLEEENGKQDARQ